MKFSVIMPALNEQENIENALTNALSAFKDLGIDGEILVINDGSRDDTRSIIERLMQKSPNIRIINHDAPRGIGASFWEGVDEAQGDAVVMLPGDNENDPWEIFRYVRLLEHVDIVIPFLFNKEKRSLFRNALSLAYRFIINTTFLVYFNYTNGTVIYRRSMLKELEYRSKGFFFQTDILIRTVKRGYLFAEVPYRINQRIGGVSKAVSFPSFLQVSRGFLRLIKDFYVDGKIQYRKSGFTTDSSTAQRYSAHHHSGFQK